ncbi:MAG: zinc ribbon domain-containing protein [Coriobacteriia bacterium]|nr:zinc ribbon domain-containing protein [Coriobacteriia bacterium]
MPAYDYRCLSCASVFELTRSLSDASEVVCPSCGGQTKRVFTPVGVVFKGSGFHNTDYRPRPKSEEPSPSGKDSCANSGQGAACATCPASE